MAKLFVAVVPESECKTHCDRIIRAFGSSCPHEVRIEPDGVDAIYYMLDETDKHPDLAEVLHYNLVMGKYTALGSMIRFDDTEKFMYGLYRAEVKPGDYTMDQFIEERG